MSEPGRAPQHEIASRGAARLRVCCWTRDRDPDFLAHCDSHERLDRWLERAAMPCAAATCNQDALPCSACRKLEAYYSAVGALRGCRPNAEELA